MDIDIPKLYFNLTDADNYEVVDGQQRLWALWGFLDGGYPYKKQLFAELDKAQRDTIRNYTLQVVVLEDAEDGYLRELFLRLQLGLLLITGEKLHAASGMMRDFVFETLAKHQFIQGVGIPERRFAKETLAAQICINSFTRAKLETFARTRYEDLLHFFQEYKEPLGKDLALFRSQTAKLIEVLDALADCFGNETKQLTTRSYILSVYLLFEELYESGRVKTKKDCQIFVQFVLDLWRRLKQEMKAGMDRSNRELYEFESLLTSAPGEKYQIEGRSAKMNEYYAYFARAGRIKGDK